MGRKASDDSAVLKKMALGLAKETYGNPWEAAGALAEEAGGHSVESARKRIHRKFLKMEETLRAEAREELGIEDEDDDEEELIYGFNAEAFERLSKYLLSMKKNSERARFVAKFLVWRKEKADLYNRIIQHVRARGSHLTPDDMLFIHTLLGKMETVTMDWMNVLWKSMAVSGKTLSEEETDKEEQTTEDK
ncbi:MAG TPA: hypothetical protein VJ725_23075 [Thermoanaerobaculia bacterium]|nr:hypothetical protein [Thermoanaerobaculia bacterium]